MRPSYLTPAIVLRSRPFGESDKIVSFITEDFGKLSGIAKGAKRSRKRFANSLELFALVKLRFQDSPHSNLSFILSSDLVTGFRRLATSLERLSYASYIGEITDGLIGEREKNSLVFHHLKGGLSYLDENEPSLRFLTSFELKLLRLAGYQPHLNDCKKCHKNGRDGAVSRWQFSLLDGGILCEACALARKELLPLGMAALDVLTALQTENNDLPTRLSLPSSVVGEIRAAVFRFVQFHIEREIKSALFLPHISSISTGAT